MLSWKSSGVCIAVPQSDPYILQSINSNKLSVQSVYCCPWLNKYVVIGCHIHTERENYIMVFQLQLQPRDTILEMFIQLHSSSPSCLHLPSPASRCVFLPQQESWMGQVSVSQRPWTTLTCGGHGNKVRPEVGFGVTVCHIPYCALHLKMDSLAKFALTR